MIKQYLDSIIKKFKYELSLLEPVWIWQALFLKKRLIKQLTIVSIRFITKNCDRKLFLVQNRKK